MICFAFFRFQLSVIKWNCARPFGLVWSPRLVYGQTAWACHHQWVNEWMAGWIVGRDSCCSVVSLWLLKLIMICWLYWILRSIHVWNHKQKMMTLSRINCLHQKIKFTFIKKSRPAGVLLFTMPYRAESMVLLIILRQLLNWWNTIWFGAKLFWNGCCKSLFQYPFVFERVWFYNNDAKAIVVLKKWYN